MAPRPRRRGKLRFRLFVDESGDHTFKAIDDPQHRYLTLMGVWFELYDRYPAFEAGMREFKDGVFGPRHDTPVILHRSDIIDRKGPFGALSDPDLCRDFDEGLLNLVGGHTYLMCAVVLDKQSHMPKRYRQLYHPYYYCLAALMERYAGWLEYRGFEGDVMAESRGRTEDKALQKAFDRLYEDGTWFHSAERFQSVLTSRKVKFRRKFDNTAGLQLSDLLAAPIKREIVGRERYPEGFGGRLVDAARTRFNCRMDTGQVEGYGKVHLT